MYFRPQAAEKALRTSEQVLVSMAMTHSSLLSADPGRLSAPHCSFCHSQEEQSLTFNKKKACCCFSVFQHKQPDRSVIVSMAQPVFNLNFWTEHPIWSCFVSLTLAAGCHWGCGFYGHLSHRNSASISRCMMRIFRAPLVGSMKTKPVA